MRLYERTAPALRSYLRLLCGNTALADDLLQEGFMRMLQVDVARLNGYQLKSYLYKAATSAAMDHFRARKRELHGLADIAQQIEGSMQTSICRTT